MGSSEPTSKDELEESLNTAKRAAAECILKSSWKFTVPGVVLSVPISIYMKSYSPLLLAAVTASGLDHFNGLQICKEKTNHVKQIQAELALAKLSPSSTN